MIVRGQSLNVDFRSELEYFDWFRLKFAGNKLIACSPFREESTPSFAVNLDNGTWIDSGGDGDWCKGNFVRLLAFLRNETYEEAEDYLLSLYSPYLGELDSLNLSLGLKLEDEKPRFFDEADLKPFMFRHPYLERRGISDRTQRAFRIGYERESEAIVMPWFDRQERLVNWKFRSVKDKRFWYASGGQKIRNHVYGIHLVYRLQKTRVAIVESEIDAMYLWQHGVPAVALGGSSLSERQRKILIQSPVETFVIATDNDRQGEKAKRFIIAGLAGLKELEEAVFPNSKKDANELTPEEIERVFNRTKSVTFAGVLTR